MRRVQAEELLRWQTGEVGKRTFERPQVMGICQPPQQALLRDF